MGKGNDILNHLLDIQAFVLEKKKFQVDLGRGDDSVFLDIRGHLFTLLAGRDEIVAAGEAGNSELWSVPQATDLMANCH